MNTLNLDVTATKLAGVAGALASLAFVKGTWPERITMAVGGAIVSLYGTAWMASRTGLPEGLSGFLLGLFGMAVCAKVWELIQSAPLALAWQALIEAAKKRLGG